MKSFSSKQNLYSALVWIFSSLTLVLYGILALFNTSLPGVEQLVSYMSSIQGTYVFASAFIIILIEGLYIVGNFFPGGSLVGILAILSQAGGTLFFLTTIFVIFLGWTTAGAINITLAHFYNDKILKQKPDDNYHQTHNLWVTWFPSLRANHEVAQVTEGGHPLNVFLTSTTIKAVVSIIMIGVTLLLPLILDINELSNEEGFITLFVVAGVSLIISVMKLRK